MAYDSSSKMITSPVAIYDTQRALGNSANDVGSLCLATNINIWARYKPIRYASVMQLTAAQWTAQRHGVYRSTNLPLFDNNNRLNHDVWTYDRPTGGDASPYRLTDFNRYYHVAPCPVRMIFPTDVITINDTAAQEILGFTLTFEQGIGMWRTDDCCLYMRDIFENSSLGCYLTIGLIHYISGNYIGYFKSSDYVLSNYIASQADAQHLAGTPVANVLVDLADFKSKVSSTYLTDGTKFQAVAFLSSSQLNGTTAITTGSTELLQYDSHVTQDSDGYEEGCDRHIMVISRVSWIGEITGMTVTTTYEREGTSTYKVTQVVITVTREANLPAWTMNIECEGICVGGVMSNNEQQSSGTFIPSSPNTISFAANETSKSVTLLATNFTRYKYLFNQIASGTISRAIMRVGLKMGGGTKSLATDADCSSGQSTITITNNT